MPTPLLHFICGSTGAGKTTYAKQLSDEIGGVRFSIDEWMSALFWMDTPKPLDPAWSIARVERCSAQIWRTALQIAGRGVPCVLEIGLMTIAVRARYRALAEDAGLSMRLHLLDVPVAERWRRVEARNVAADAAGQLAFEITREMFDFVETMWEPPTPEEMANCDGAWVASRGRVATAPIRPTLPP